MNDNPEFIGTKKTIRTNGSNAQIATFAKSALRPGNIALDSCVAA